MSPTRRDIIKSLSALAVTPVAVRTAVSGASAPSDDVIPETGRVPFLNLYGPDNGGVVRIGRGVGTSPSYRNWGITRDLDGSWTVDVCARPVTADDWSHGGSILVTDPTIAAFLESFFELWEDPDAFGHRE